MPPDSGIETADSTTIYGRALELYEDSTVDEQREFIRSILNVVVAESIETQQFDARIQQGLEYDPDYEELLEEWSETITGWEVTPVPQSMSQRVNIYLEAKTIDVALINTEAAEFPPSLCVEHRVPVECYLEAELSVTPMVINDGVRVTVVLGEDQ